ncbi:hypothetical protein VTP01DRAFT_5523 [Rhizomucor pusillus]|uniref:uncharacterized protein n=1 Tax=Rhizomucor pusillus TaxID=4840 RepID=UPI003743A086
MANQPRDSNTVKNSAGDLEGKEMKYQEPSTAVSAEPTAQPRSSLKRKESDMDKDDVYVTDLSQQDAKRMHKERDYARDLVNADDELWQILTALKETSRTPGVIPRLEPQFTNLNKKGNTLAAYLCSPYTDHIATGFMDLGWGCGYRNCQMLMTFLQRQREAGDYLLRQVADISGLQMLLERAWQEGFDPQGAAQLNHRVYKTRKWIGTTEVYCMLVYLGIRCTILDFHRPSGPKNSHDSLFNWIQSYFEDALPPSATAATAAAATSTSSSSSSTKATPLDAPSSKKNKKKVVYITNRPPLYLQHSGHSRTVIGIELLKDGRRNLIMFDPGRRMLRSYRTNKVSNVAPTAPEDDIDESALSSSVTGDEDESDDSDDSRDGAQKSEQPSLASRFLANWTNREPLPANMLRPFRVDAKTIAKNRQYQLLVLGEVVDERENGGGLVWKNEKGYLLDERERETMKSVTSVTAL